MGLTNFPNGISVGDGQTAVPGYAGGEAIFAAGTVIVTGGSAAVATGLSAVTFAVASPYGVMAGTADFDIVSAQPTSGGTIFVRAQSAGGTASVSAGTATWIAIGS